MKSDMKGRGRNKLERTDRLVRLSLLVVAFSAVSTLAVITIFMFEQGAPIMFKYGLRSFLAGSDWYPTEKIFGLWPMIVGSLYVTLGAMVIGVPFGLACAVVLTEFSSRPVRRVIKPVIELLAGIPSVVYGFIGVVILVPFIRENLGGPGLSVLAASIILGIMILPTIISISVDSIQAIPLSYRAFGMGRAIGETMAVIMIAGNAASVPRSVLDPVRTLTSNIALEMGYASGEHRQALFATGVILFIIIMILNTVANVTSSRMKGSKG